MIETKPFPPFPSITTTPEQAYELVKNGVWSAEIFVEWYDRRTQDAYNHGTDAGYDRGYMNCIAERDRSIQPFL